MTESSVSSPFMKQLRTALPGAVVIKLHDASLIGLWDCLVIWNYKVAAIEFKLVIPPKSGVIDVPLLVRKAETQYQLMRKVTGEVHLGIYLLWVKKSRRIIAFDPLKNLTLYEAATTPEMVAWVAECLSSL